VIWPLRGAIGGNAGRYRVVGASAVEVSWELADGGRLLLQANLSPSRVSGFDMATGRVFWGEGEASADGVLGPWAVRWSV
jgi:hypothetical protein